MDHFAGLDVSVKETSVCIVDDTGRILREVKVTSDPEALLQVLRNPAYRFKRIGLEAGPLSQWLFSALAEAGLPVICVETRHMQVLKAQINKTDGNDARGVAQMMRGALPSGACQDATQSETADAADTSEQSKAIAIENDLRGTLRNFGLEVGMVGTMKFEARIKELIENLPDLAALVEPLRMVRRVLREQFVILHGRLLAIARDDEVCRRASPPPGGCGRRCSAVPPNHRLGLVVDLLAALYWTTQRLAICRWQWLALLSPIAVMMRAGSRALRMITTASGSAPLK